MSKELIIKKFNTPPVKVRQNNWVEIFENISNECKIESVLNIGVGAGHAALYWNEFLSEIWPVQYLENLEIDEAICKSAKASQNPLIGNVQLGDVRKIAEIYDDNAFDLIFWSHGPEHIYRNEWEDAFKNVEKVASKVVILQVPWGNGYDYDDGHLSKSIVKGEIEKFDYRCYYDGINNTKNAGITGYKIV